MKWITRWWEWLVLAFTLLTLALFLTGHNLFGFSNHVSWVLALIGTLAAAVLSFLFATLVVPIIALVTGAIAALIAAVMGLASLIIGGIFTPIAVLLSGWVTAIFTWLAGTWLGTLLMPFYNVLAPVILKIAPWITVSKSASRAWQMTEKIPALHKALQSIGLKAVSKPRRQQAAASQSEAPGRSSARGKHQSAPARKKR